MRFRKFHWVLVLLVHHVWAQEAWNKLYTGYFQDYEKLGIPATELDYHDNFANIASPKALAAQEKFVRTYKKRLDQVDVLSLETENRLQYQLLAFELRQQQRRIQLEKRWNRGTKQLPSAGLYSLKNHKEWYAYYVAHFTGVDISPEQVFVLGQQEVAMAKQEIEAIQRSLKFISDSAFYAELRKDRFFSNSKEELLRRFAQIDSCVRNHLPQLFACTDVPEVKAMEWPGADRMTPPGIYLSRDDNPYQVDVFQFNFASGNYNLRCMDWLYMHEAIPGHHLQHYCKKQNHHLFYFGTAEGWACYVESLGKDLGLYRDVYSYLGLQEWNLVRSARLVMEVGIHYYGWDADKAMRYWKEQIRGQDEIAEREIKRITKWPGQSLCYKVGAVTIQKIIAKKKQEGMTLKQAHTFLLEHSEFPLEALL